MRRTIQVTILVQVLVMWACGGGVGTSKPDAHQDTFDAQWGTELPVIFPDSKSHEDALPDGHLHHQGELHDLSPEAVWGPTPCQSHVDCEDGFCVEVLADSGQFFCAPTCIEECPGDWLCKAVHLDGPDLVSICLPGDGCQGAEDGVPCNGADPCLVYACQAGFCVGTPVEFDLIPDGIDEDCDGQTDEDVYLGFRLISSTLTAGSGVQSGGGWVLTGTLSLSGFAGQSVAGETVLIPGTQ